MAREYVALCLAVLVPGCSLILDFSDRAIPKDAPIDSRFTAAECAYDEPNDTAATAHALQSGETGPAAICSSGGTDDLDYYSFQVPMGTMATTISISFQNQIGDLDL